MYLSVIIPAYNEETRIKKTLQEINHYLSNKEFPSEIIVVNDGSSDKTLQVAENLDISNLKIVNLPENKGKGYAVRQGMMQALGKYRLFTDADNSTPIKEIEILLPYLENGYDLVIGSRGIKGANVKKRQPLYRLALGKLYKVLTQLSIGLSDFSDTQCGFKVLSNKAANDILPKCLINGWSFDPEILVIAKKFNYKIKEIPVTWVDQGKTKMRIDSMAKSIVELIKIRYSLLSGKYD